MNKKNQKNFLFRFMPLACVGGMVGSGTRQSDKSFLLLFFKKGDLPFYWSSTASAAARAPAVPQWVSLGR